MERYQVLLATDYFTEEYVEGVKAMFNNFDSAVVKVVEWRTFEKDPRMIEGIVEVNNEIGKLIINTINDADMCVINPMEG